MPEKRYFSKMGIYAFTGLVALIIALAAIAGLALLFAPMAALIAVAFAGVAAAVAVLVLVFAFIFGLALLLVWVGVFIEYVRKPMTVQHKNYSAKGVSEAGLRGKGSSKTRRRNA